MKSLISECLLAAGITRVVWIDDFFAPPTYEELVTAINKYVAKLKEQKQSNINHAKFEGISLSLSITEIEDACDAVIENLTHVELSESAASLGRLCGASPEIAKSQMDDLSPEDFDNLQKAFGTNLETFCQATWTTTGSYKFKAATEETLFLIDKEFKRESSGLSGTDILKDIVNGTTSFCIMLTHTCGEEHQEEQRVVTATEKGLKPHRFCFLSKRQGKELAIDPRFAGVINSAMTHRFTGEIAFKISEAIQKSADQTALDLTKQDVTNLEQALFKNAITEGVLEYEVVLRVFDIERRYALNDALKDPLIQARLQSVRRFREQTRTQLRKKTRADMTYFVNLRQREVFLEGTGLNALHAPLACGDVFKTNDGESYLFLAQPCDLMMRKQGKRKAEIGFLAIINEQGLNNSESPCPERYFDLKKLFGGEKAVQVDFRQLFVVDISIIDLAVFNSDGKLRLSSNHPSPSIVLTPGWEIRFGNLKKEFFPDSGTPSVRSIGIGETSRKLLPVLENDVLSYPLQRIGRLEPNTARAVLAGWAIFQTRAAFDHDFAEIK